MSDQFYYPTVTEYEVGTASNGKTVYKYDGLAETLGVVLTAEEKYGYRNGGFDTLKKTLNYYNLKRIINFTAYTQTPSSVSESTGQACPAAPLGAPDVDMFAMSFFYKGYNTHPYPINSWYSQLDSTVEISFDQKGQNPLTVRRINYYDNPQYLQPTKTVVYNSKGEEVTTESKFALDYPITSCVSLYTLDTTFRIMRDSIVKIYGDRSYARYLAASPLLSNTSNWLNEPLIDTLANYPAEAELATGYATLLSNLNSGITSYYSCLTTNGVQSSTLTEPLRAITVMQKTNIKSIPIEQRTSISKNGNSYLTGAVKTDFMINSAGGIAPKTLYAAKTNNGTLLKSTFLSSPSTYYESRVNFKYDVAGNIIEQSKTNDIKQSYLWDYNSLYPTAQVLNADSGHIAYSSFESNGNGNWSVPSTDRNTSNQFTGAQSYSLTNGSVSKSGLNSSLSYRVSFWVKSGSGNINSASPTITTPTRNGWQYAESTVTGVTSVSISGTGLIDELRLYPSNAQMITYTYEPLIGVTSNANVNNSTTSYEYDWLGRLKLIRDQNKNVAKLIDYKIGVSAAATNASWYTNSTSCVIHNGMNTGEMLHNQTDINPASPTYNQTRTISVGCNAGCVLTNCSAEGKRNVNCNCETGTKIFTLISTVPIQCSWYYVFSDGYVSQVYYGSTLSACGFD